MNRKERMNKRKKAGKEEVGMKGEKKSETTNKKNDRGNGVRKFGKAKYRTKQEWKEKKKGKKEVHRHAEKKEQKKVGTKRKVGRNCGKKGGWEEGRKERKRVVVGREAG